MAIATYPHQKSYHRSQQNTEHGVYPDVWNIHVGDLCGHAVNYAGAGIN